MVKRSRVEPCPCGSGRKRKNCHPTMPTIMNVSGMFGMQNNKKVAFVTKDILINQIYRDSSKISRSFDDIARGTIEKISPVYGDISFIIFRYLNSFEKEDIGVRPTCARLFINSFQSFSASIQVARFGYRRDYGNIARSVVETLSVIVHLIGDDDAIENFHQGDLKSTKSVTYATKKFGVLGPLWGFLSNQFVHIGPSSAHARFTECYNKEDDDIDFIINNMRALTVLYYIVAELVFFEQFDEPRYWERIGDREYRTNPSDEARKWQAEILGIKIEDMDSYNHSENE